jgi:hypothetical protein
LVFPRLSLLALCPLCAPALRTAACSIFPVKTLSAEPLGEVCHRRGVCIPCFVCARHAQVRHPILHSVGSAHRRGCVLHCEPYSAPSFACVQVPCVGFSRTPLSLWPETETEVGEVSANKKCSHPKQYTLSANADSGQKEHSQVQRQMTSSESCDTLNHHKGQTGRTH